MVDYEAAWIELQGEIAGKSQHGRDSLLVSMARIARENRVPEGDKARLLRLHGIEVNAAAMQIDSDTPEDLPGGTSSAGDIERPGHHDQQGGHDGTATRTRRAVAV